MRRTLSLAAALAVFSLTMGCASSGSSTSRVRESSPDRITAAEIEATQGASTALDLVRRLRPRWLQSGGVASIAGGQVSSQVLLVYLDGNRLGSADVLRTLTASGIKGMQYYDAVRAATVLRDVGSDAISGAIAITTR